MMVEVPSAVMMLDHFAEEVDFFSIGTNDLIQYALAVDRSNKDVAGLYTAADPAVLRLIDMAVRTAKKHEVPISMCGQMCGNPLYTMLLLGIGLRSMSVTPAAMPEIKQVCRRVSISGMRTRGRACAGTGKRPRCENIFERGIVESVAGIAGVREGGCRDGRMQVVSRNNITNSPATCHPTS